MNTRTTTLVSASALAISLALGAVANVSASQGGYYSVPHHGYFMPHGYYRGYGKMTRHGYGGYHGGPMSGFAMHPNYGYAGGAKTIHVIDTVIMPE